MLFHIDPTKYRVLDLSTRIVPPGTADRPLIAKRGLLADDTFKHDVATHTHVGTHIESPAHFIEGGKRLENMPLDRFYGRAVLFDFAGIACEPIGGKELQADVGSLLRDGDILLCRNTHPQWRRVHAEDRKRLPYLCADGARWLVARKVKLLVIDDFCGIRIANGKDVSRENHAILMAAGVEMPVIEFPDGLEQLRRKEFFFMALPLRIEGLDSVWARAIAIEEL
jgi:kynurenine formamidase